MNKAGWIRAGSLLLATSVGVLTGCADEANKPVATDASAATGSDSGSSTGSKDSGAPTATVDAGRPPTPSTDAGPPVIDAAAAIDNATLPAAENLSGPEGTGVCEAMVNDQDCDKTKLPIVFVHGTVANADSFAHPAKLFASNGYCPDRIRGIEYHSLIASADAGAAFVLDRAATYAAAKAAIDAEIASLQAEFKVDKVDLAGHSQGAGHGAVYVGENPSKIAHYINLAGGELKADPGGVPTLNLSSIGDRPVDAGTAKSVIFQDPWLDHSAVSSSTESFVEMYKFLNDGKEPKYKTVQCGSPITIEGKARTFAENAFLPGSKVEVYELGDAARERGAPVQSYTLTADAKFGPFEAKPGVAYEFKMVPPEGDTTRRPGRAYLAPFVRSDRLLRFNFETKDPVAAATSGQVNRDPSFAVIIPRSRQKAFLAQRDSLTIDGFEVLSRGTTMTVAPATGMVRSAVTVAYYLYDRSLTPGTFGPGDGKTTGESIIKGTFVNSADVFVPSATPKFVEVKYGGRTIKVPNWPSASEGASVVFLN